MADAADRTHPPCLRCRSASTVRTGHTRGRQRWRCAGCRRTFGPTTGTALAEAVVQATRQRMAAAVGVPWISDGWAAYAEVVADSYCDVVPAGIPEHGWSILHRTPGVSLTQAVKHRRGRRLVRIEVRATLGSAVAQPYPVHIERLNGVLRDRLACLTRKTHAFAKQLTLWDAAVGLALFADNWLRPHPALRVPLAEPVALTRYRRCTPAMLLSLTDHPWSFVEFLTHPVPHYPWG